MSRQSQQSQYLDVKEEERRGIVARLGEADTSFFFVDAGAIDAVFIVKGSAQAMRRKIP